MASWKQGHARTIFWWKFWFETASASLFIYLFIIILPWPFISASGLTVLLCWNCYLISFIPKRIQLIKAARKIFSRGLQAQELSGGVCILCICVCLLVRKREEEVTKIRKLPYVFSHRKWYSFVFCFNSLVATSQSLWLSLSANGKPSLKILTYKVKNVLKFHPNFSHHLNLFKLLVMTLTIINNWNCFTVMMTNHIHVFYFFPQNHWKRSGNR